MKAISISMIDERTARRLHYVPVHQNRANSVFAQSNSALRVNGAVATGSDAPMKSHQFVKILVIDKGRVAPREWNFAHYAASACRFIASATLCSVEARGFQSGRKMPLRTFFCSPAIRASVAGLMPWRVAYSRTCSTVGSITVIRA